MDATLITAWTAMCQELAPAFTGPTFVTFLQIATGWVLCRSEPKVTNLICTIGTSLLGHAARHWTVYEKFFYRASWSLPKVSGLLLTRIIVPLIDRCAVEPQIDLVIDDTTCGRSGKHVAFAGYFKDASISNTAQAVVHWSHNWVLGALTLRPKRWPNWVLAMPVLFTLYRKATDCNRAHPFVTRQQIAAQMIHTLRQALPERTIRIAADGAYATKELAKAALECHSDLVSRIRSDAALNERPGARERGWPGRRKKKGPRLPTPRQLAAQPRNDWRIIEVLAYGQRVKRQVFSMTCLWYHVAKEQPIKLLIVRDPAGIQKDDYLFSTGWNTPDEQILERFAARWPIEECIHDGKQLGGFEQVQGWCPRTVERQAPMALIVQSLVKAWYLLQGVAAIAQQPQGSHACGWMQPKDHPSYLDMLATLRGALWTHRINSNSTWTRRVRKLLEPLRFTLCAAA